MKINDVNALIKISVLLDDDDSDSDLMRTGGTGHFRFSSVQNGGGQLTMLSVSNSREIHEFSSDGIHWT